MTNSHRLRLQVGGTVNPTTGVYIVRPSDDELLELLERGEYANVLCSRQMGKSSLLQRTKSLLEKKGYAVAAMDVGGCLGSPEIAEEWYQGLLDEIVRQLDLNIEIRSWWRSSPAITANQRLLQFFRELTANCAKQVIVFLDEIDSTLRLPYTDDFFVAIRAMYNNRPSDPVFDRINFCLVGVASPNELIKDRRYTSYNIGRTIELQDFDADRDNLEPLFEALGRGETGKSIVHSVMKWTGGHPYLTLRLCERLNASGRTAEKELDRLMAQEFASLDHVHSDVHFQQIVSFLSERVEDSLSALTLYKRIRSGEKMRDHTTPQHIALKLAGLVKRDRLGYLMVRNEIYARVFTEGWVSKSVGPTAAFDKLLESLAPNRDLAGQEYERVRRALIKVFLARGFNSAEELADLTIERVLDRLEKGEVISDFALYCFGVARHVMAETSRQSMVQADVNLDHLLSFETAIDDRVDSEVRFNCLERCLQRLSAEDRNFILRYYQSEGQAKIENRRALAAQSGVSINTLRIRAYRLRQRLEDCVMECLSQETIE